MNNLHQYLHDHLAGADLALELLESLSHHHSDEITSTLAARILTEVRDDRQILGRLADSVESGSNIVKELASSIGAKALRVSLNPSSGDNFDLFQVLEFLAAGVFGKMLLWRALEVVLQRQASGAGISFQQLLARAEGQYAQLEKRRLELATQTLGSHGLEHVSMG